MWDDISYDFRIINGGKLVICLNLKIENDFQIDLLNTFSTITIPRYIVILHSFIIHTGI